MNITKMRLIILLSVLSIFMLMLYGSRRPAAREYGVEYTEPAMLYGASDPVKILASQEWHGDAQTNHFDKDKAFKETSLDSQNMILPEIKISNRAEPITIAFDYAGKDTINQKFTNYPPDIVFIQTRMTCPTSVEQCGTALPDDLQNIRLDLTSMFTDIANMSDGGAVKEYGGWLHYKQNRQAERSFVYHKKVLLNLPATDRFQLSLHLAAPQGMDTQYFRVTAIEGATSYLPSPPDFARISGGKAIIASPLFRDVFTLVMALAPIMFIRQFKKEGAIPEDTPKIFGLLLIAWGSLVFTLGWIGTFSVSFNDLIAVGALIACAGVGMVFRPYIGLILLALAMLMAWLTAIQFSLSGKALFMHTGLISMVMAYAFYVHLARQFD